MEELEEMFEEIHSLHQLQADKLMLGNEMASISRRFQIVDKKINQKLPSIMDIQERNRKIEVINNQELEELVTMLQEDFTNNDQDSKVSTEANEEDELSCLRKSRRRYSKKVKAKAKELVLKFGIQKVIDKLKSMRVT